MAYQSFGKYNLLFPIVLCNDLAVSPMEEHTRLERLSTSVKKGGWSYSDGLTPSHIHDTLDKNGDVDI